MGSVERIFAPLSPYPVTPSLPHSLCANVGETLDPREIREGGEVR